MRCGSTPLPPSPPSDPVHSSQVAARCVGFSGADLRALCQEALLVACHRRVPNLLSGEINRTPNPNVLAAVSNLTVDSQDFRLYAILIFRSMQCLVRSMKSRDCPNYACVYPKLITVV